MAHRLDVTVQEADRVDALDGLQDLAAQTQGGADAEGSPAHTAPQVSQVTTLREQKRSNITKKKKKTCASFIYLKENKIPLSGSIHTNLQLHHHVVEAIVAAASHKATHVILTWCEKEDVTVSGYFEKRSGRGHLM